MSAPTPVPLPVEAAGGDPQDWASPTEGTALPYDFVPVLPDAIRAEPPVWHDGSNPAEESLYSGELCCTLRTLSPTIVGNQQFARSEVEDTVASEIDARRKTDWNAEEITERNRRITAAAHPNVARINQELSDDRTSLKGAINKKKLLLPLRAAFLHGSPVLIPGESLSGMVRQSLGALLNAPIERIQPASFSYRPNVEVPKQPLPSRPVAAEVVKADLDRLHLEVEVFGLQGLMFVHGDDATLFGGSTLPLDLGNPFTAAEWAKKPVPRQPRECIEPARGQVLTLNGSYRALRYQFGTAGLDGFALNGPRGRPRPHPSVIVPKGHRQSVVIHPAIVRQYLETRRHLGDAQYGHLSRARGDKLKPNWRECDHVRPLEPGDLIFCEVVECRNPRTLRVVSFGHNFRYRWRHLNGVTEIVKHFDPGSGQWQTTRRQEMRAHADEKAGADGRPDKLTAVRNMFGYVIDGRSDTLKAAQPQFADPFDRLAGRVSFNFALERVADGDTDAQRFLRADEGRWVFLHPTVEPKPQFGRSYVPGQGRNWGGGLLVEGGKVHVQHWTRWFAGRKFYPHQGKYEPDKNVIDLPAHHYDLQALMRAPQQTAHTRWELLKFLWGDQAQVARDVCVPGREFGFTVRFKSLRRHELAALAAALSPQLLVEALRELPQGSPLKPAASDVSGQAVFANKLGHGRALGLGSVAVTIDGGVRWSQKSGGVDESLGIEALKRCITDTLLSGDPGTGSLNATVLKHWLRVLQLNPARQVKPYLLKHDGKTMIGWSNNQRQAELRSTRSDPFPGILNQAAGAAHAQPHAGHAAGGSPNRGQPHGGGHQGQGGNRNRGGYRR